MYNIFVNYFFMYCRCEKESLQADIQKVVPYVENKEKMYSIQIKDMKIRMNITLEIYSEMLPVNSVKLNKQNCKKRAFVVRRHNLHSSFPNIFPL